MTSASLDLTAAELFELAFREARKGIDQSRQVNRQLQAAMRMKFLVSRASSVKARLGAVFGKPESVVKHVRKGGVRNAHELRRQINYLTDRAEGVLDIRDNGVTPLDADQVSALIDTWAEDFTGKTNFGYTRHMIVSFPAGTYADAAHQAGLEFADRLFGSGDFGDTWDYLSVFHTDTNNPHVHLVVNCRGVEHGQWLAMGMTSDMNIDVQRSLHVEAAEEFGIELTATTRLERGLRHEVETETWKVQAGISVAEGTSEVEAKARDAAADVLLNTTARLGRVFDQSSRILAAQIADVTKQYLEGSPPMIAQNANLLREADAFARDISSKHDDKAPQAFVRAIATRWSAREGLGSLDETFQKQVNGFVSAFQDKEAYQPFVSSLADLTDHTGFKGSQNYLTRSERLQTGIEATIDAERFKAMDAKTADIVKSIEGMERIAEQVEDPRLRARMDVQIGELKGDVADLRPFDVELQPYAMTDDRYAVPLGTDQLDKLIGDKADAWSAARASIVERADQAGIDPDPVLAHYASQQSVPLGTSLEWREAETRQVMSASTPGTDRDAAHSIVEQLHQFASARIAQLGVQIRQDLELDDNAHQRGRAIKGPTHSRDDDGHSL
ncbi:relaxase/mobilization nuclease domain-containing protein [uncultured Ruegeria sp.]|uniref:relaxase/mobilization nuclease domain-containing protein n=1 Tax=uncultured Ruegeria sp. TaxID=259304 RepID=UPI002630D88D|nr:relaxase/mobilization nuclease domain-containing protein [uncultured Ruegeria sp.]